VRHLESDAAVEAGCRKPHAVAVVVGLGLGLGLTLRRRAGTLRHAGREDASDGGDGEKLCSNLCSFRICSRRALKRCSERMYAARKVLSEQQHRGGRMFAVSRAAIIGWL